MNFTLIKKKDKERLKEVSSLKDTKQEYYLNAMWNPEWILDKEKLVIKLLLGRLSTSQYGL